MVCCQFDAGVLTYLPLLVQKDEGIKLVCEAICSGIFNDLGSGSNVDVCVITKVSHRSSSLEFSYERFHFCCPG